MEELFHGETSWLEGAAAFVPSVVVVRRCIASEAEEEAQEDLNEWILTQGRPLGSLSYDFADPETG
jgi:hypothetical protein